MSVSGILLFFCWLGMCDSGIGPLHRYTVCCPSYRYLDEEEGRVEVILEGSDRIDSTWKEYNFRFKPGDISDRLPIACTQYTLIGRDRHK